MPNNVFENPFLDVCGDRINKLVSSDLHSKYTNVEDLKNQSPSWASAHVVLQVQSITEILVGVNILYVLVKNKDGVLEKTKQCSAKNGRLNLSYNVQENKGCNKTVL